MSLVLYNTLSRLKEVFDPADSQRVTMYVCGPTVYNYIHIGNARPIVAFDVLYRLLLRLYPQVLYARNITDVDDKINAAAKENAEPISTLAARYTDAFHEDVAALNTLPPTIEPRATTHIDTMIRMTEALLASGHAYEADAHVLFAVSSMPEYGRLSGRNREDMIAGARVEVAPYKRDPADFVLWKPSTDDLPGWPSPWGRGRPGWHLECSSMIETHLGDTIDIHGGGQDLIFPHHENEIAQSTCAHDGKIFVRFWVHNGYVTVSGDKMSKSLGNFFTLRELLQQFPGEAIRYGLLSGHYRKPLDWSPGLIHQAKTSLDRLYQALAVNKGRVEPEENAVPEELMAALEDDLNTPLALSHLHEIAHRLNSTQDTAESMQLKKALLSSGELLGLLQQDPATWLRWAPPSQDGLADEAIEALIRERDEARGAKDFNRADEIRDQLSQQNIQLEDSPAGTRWRRSAKGQA
jgi:cysteinyl-tRNA synthetase